MNRSEPEYENPQQNSLKENIWDCQKIITIWPHDETKFDNNNKNDPLNKIYPHVEHVLLLFKACKELKIDRIIMAGSISSIIGGKAQKEYKEDCWADISKINTEEKCKLYAERMAWYLIKEEKYDINLTVLNLGVLFGPSIIMKKRRDFESGSSIKFEGATFMSKIFSGKMKYNLHIKWPIVDVRDAAQAFCKCLSIKEKIGRVIVSQGEYWMSDLIRPLNEEFKGFRYNQPNQVLGKFPAFFMSFIDEEIKNIYSFIGLNYTQNKSKAKKLLKINYREVDETMIEMAYNLIDQNVIKNRIISKSKKDKSDKGNSVGTAIHSVMKGFTPKTPENQENTQKKPLNLEDPDFNDNLDKAEKKMSTLVTNGIQNLPSTPNLDQDGIYIEYDNDKKDTQQNDLVEKISKKSSL